MDPDSIPVKQSAQSLSQPVIQPALFDFHEASAGAVELFPTVWKALEDVVSPKVSTRQKGLDSLLDLSAPRLSPLVAYMLVTRIADPDLNVRARVVRALGEVLSPDQNGLAAPEPVSQLLFAHLSLMRLTTVVDLLEVVDFRPKIFLAAARLFDACPSAGAYLAEVLSDRKQPVGLRVQAAKIIGQVGFLEAIPALERLEVRLEARLDGQQVMPFAPPPVIDERSLLPAVREALARLTTP